jgi:hypothetical protein
MANQTWTFETLAQASRSTLEQVLLASKAPNPQQLVGYVYAGYNHDWLGQLPGKKFRKAFLAKNNHYYGLNQLVEQDGHDYTGHWRPRTANDRPLEMGFFSVVPASSSAANCQVRPYNHLLCFDYNIDFNPKGNVLLRAIRDYVGLPNEGDYDLVLGKAYLQLTSFLSIFATYFVLGHREPYDRTEIALSSFNG